MRNTIVGFFSWISCVAAVLTSCTKPNPAATCTDGTCVDPAFPFCDADGAVGGEPGVCISVDCIPSKFMSCDGDQAITCNASGTNYEITPCEYGCNATMGCNECAPGATKCDAGTVSRCDDGGRWTTAETCTLSCVDSPAPHCAYLQPKYLPGVCDARATKASLAITASTTFDTSVDAACADGVVPQASGPDLCLLHYGTITVDAAATFKVVGNRALALIADDELTITGILDVSADGTVSGPGAEYGCSGSIGGSINGGGGAGFKTAGGAGGSATTDGGAANAGVVASDPAGLNILVGGPHGCNGGGGGGAVTLISCHGMVKIDGTIDAGGGGGPGGLYVNSMTSGGTGGGAGGYVVLQGLNVTVTGSMYSNGGGGGGGNPQVAVERDGADAPLSSMMNAAGGSGAGGAGAGGSGGSVRADPTNGHRPTTSGDSAGGGGGSMGFLQTYTAPSGMASLTPVDASPTLETNQSLPTR